MDYPDRSGFIKGLIVLVLVCFTNICRGQEDVLFEARKNGQYGLIDTKGNWILKPSFDSINEIECGRISFYRKGRLGIADRRGRIIVPPVWSWMLIQQHLILAGNDSLYTVLAAGTGKRLCPFYKGTSIYVDGFIAVQDNSTKWGFLNDKGKLVIPCKYDSVGDFDGGVAKVYLDGQSQFINRSGEDTVGAPAYLVWRTEYDRRFMINGKYGMLIRRGDTMLRPIYDDLGISVGDYYEFSIDGKYGIMDTSGTVICKPQYDLIRTVFSDGAIAQQDCMWGYIDVTGKVLIPFRFEEITSLYSGYGAAKYNGKWGIINSSGAWVVTPTFEHIKELHFLHDLNKCP